MKNIRQLLREKEAELEQLQKEIEALRLAATLLSQETSSAAAAPIVAVSGPKPPVSVPSSEEHISGITVSGTPASRQFP
jgi:hypothetical protein